MQVNDSANLKGRYETEKTLSEVAQRVQRVIANQLRCIIAAAAASHPMNSDSEQMSKLVYE
jgi:hypothetical protein